MNKIFLLILLSGLCGGSIYPLLKLGEAASIPQFTYIFWEGVIVCTVVAMIAIIRKENFWWKREELPYYIFCAVTNILIPQSLMFIIADHVPVSLFSLIITLTPIFVYLALVVLGRSRWQALKIAGVFVGFTGVAFLFVPEIMGLSLATLSLGWLLFTFLVPLDYTLNRVIASQIKPEGSSTTRLTFGLFSFVILGAGCAMFLTDQASLPFMPWTIGSTALLAHGGVMIGFCLAFFYLAGISALQNSLSLYIAPLVGASWGVVLFHEVLDIWIMAAAMLIFLGLYLINKPTRD